MQNGAVENKIRMPQKKSAPLEIDKSKIYHRLPRRYNNKPRVVSAPSVACTVYTAHVYRYAFRMMPTPWSHMHINIAVGISEEFADFCALFFHSTNDIVRIFVCASEFKQFFADLFICAMLTVRQTTN